MKFVRAISGYNHLWAVRDEAKEADELTLLFRKWSNVNYLLDFFLANLDDLQGFFRVERISDAIKDTMEDARFVETTCKRMASSTKIVSLILSRRTDYERENIKIS